jgi:hypothetical protein
MLLEKPTIGNMPKKDTITSALRKSLAELGHAEKYARFETDARARGYRIKVFGIFITEQQERSIIRRMKKRGYEHIAIKRVGTIATSFHFTKIQKD